MLYYACRYVAVVPIENTQVTNLVKTIELNLSGGTDRKHPSYESC